MPSGSAAFAISDIVVVWGGLGRIIELGNFELEKCFPRRKKLGVWRERVERETSEARRPPEKLQRMGSPQEEKKREEEGEGEDGNWKRRERERRIC